MFGRVKFLAAKLFRPFSPVFVLISISLAVLLPGCSFSPPFQKTSTQPTLPPFVSGATEQQEVENTAPTAILQATATPAQCTDGLTFINDLTIPDGSVIQPGAIVDKRWEVQNSGSCNWDETYSFRLVAGEELGAGTQRALIPARAGANVSLRVVFTAPVEAGNYRTAWQAFSPSGEAFGDPVYMEIQVGEP